MFSTWLPLASNPATHTPLSRHSAGQCYVCDVTPQLEPGTCIHNTHRKTFLPAGANRLWQYHSGSVNGLENALQVDPPGNLSDQNWSHPLGAQLLVDAQEVNLHHLLLS